MSKTAKFKEIEFKYDVSFMTEDTYPKIIEALGVPTCDLDARGWDYYYTSDRVALRYRAGINFDELTIKQKLNSENNFIRIENNIKLDSFSCSSEELKKKIDRLAEQLNLKFDFAVFKECDIRFYPGFNIVKYSVQSNLDDPKLWFFEIEMDENHPWKTQQQAWAKLVSIEKKISGITPLIAPDKRLKKSILEMYSKNNVLTSKTYEDK